MGKHTLKQNNSINSVDNKTINDINNKKLIIKYFAAIWEMNFSSDN